VGCYLHTTALRRGETASVTRPENWVNPSTAPEALVKKGVLPLPGVKLKLLSRPAHSLGMYGAIPAPLSSASSYMTLLCVGKSTIKYVQYFLTLGCLPFVHVF